MHAILLSQREMAKEDSNGSAVTEETPVDCKSHTAFESIESAQEYLSLLAQTVLEAKQEIESDISSKGSSEKTRRVEALRTVLYNLEKLDRHLKASRRLLNDLRTLRRLLHQERQLKAA